MAADLEKGNECAPMAELCAVHCIEHISKLGDRESQGPVIHLEQQTCGLWQKTSLHQHDYHDLAADFARTLLLQALYPVITLESLMI